MSDDIKVCPVCKGAGYLVKDVPYGHPDFGKLYPCQCKVEELEQKRTLDLRQVSNLQHLSNRRSLERGPLDGTG